MTDIRLGLLRLCRLADHDFCSGILEDFDLAYSVESC